MKTETIDLSITEIDLQAANILGHEYAIKYTALPVSQSPRHLWVAMDHNVATDAAVIRDLEDITGLHIMPLIAPAEDIRFHINDIYGEDEIQAIVSQSMAVNQPNKINEPDPELAKIIMAAPVVKLLKSIIDIGVANRASDIHIEPLDSQLRARYRIDGRLTSFAKIRIDLHPNVISRLKIMANMDIMEKRRPQDGHFTEIIQGEKIDFRVSTISTAQGEKAVIRLLYGQTGRLKKEELGFFEDDLEDITRLFHQPHGAIFITGPTGSGKSTTLSSFIEELNSPNKNIITIEDPIEHPIPGVNHIGVDRGAGLDFSNILRSILRQDPNIIMVGEVRDKETAKLSVQAALTGHLMLSTLHTNDAPGVIERLIDMGVDNYIVASALMGVISQRLVRRLCPACKKPVAPSSEIAGIFGLAAGHIIYEATGCARCYHTGYKGRLAIYEYIIIDHNHRRLMAKEPFTVAEQLRQDKRLRRNIARNLLAGNTSVSEVISFANM